MCGRFALKSLPAIFAEFHVPPVDWPPSYNIAPTQSIPVVRATDGTREVAFMHWGLIPPWAKSPAIGNKMINARAETLAEKPVFRQPLQRRRCIIPADGFYEWKRDGKHKQPYYISRTDHHPLAFAGLYERWRDPAGQTLESCTVITTAPNDLMRTIHDRMPAILPPAHYDRWLTSTEPPESLRAELLVPLPSDQLQAHPVSTRVNRPANNDPDCLLPATPPADPSLFG